MEHKKDIGKVFREKLDQLDKMPSDNVWASIEADLPKKKKRRLLFWLFFSSLFVLTLIYFGTDGFNRNPFGTNKPSGIENNDNGFHQRENTGGSLNGSDDTFHPGTVVRNSKGGNPSENTETNTVSDYGGNDTHNNKENTTVPGNDKYSGKKLQRNASTDKNQFASKVRKAKKQSRKPASGKDVNRFENGISENGIVGNNLSGDKDASGENPTSNLSGENVNNLIQKGQLAQQKEGESTQKDSVPKDIAKKDVPKDKPKDSTQTVTVDANEYRTFSIFLYGSPTYYSRFSSISNIDRRLDSLPGRAQVTFNYGGYLCLDYDEKWSVRAGISRTDFKYITKDVPVSSLQWQSYYSVEYDAGVNNQTIYSQFANLQHFDIIQELSYLEFPIEVKYKFFDNTIDISGIGGISTLFLKKNILTAEADNNGGSAIMGKMRNISNASFTANLGIGFSYGFAKNFKINAEPMFKYHFRTASVALQPYSIVVQAGIEYTFNSRNREKTIKK